MNTKYLQSLFLIILVSFVAFLQSNAQSIEEQRDEVFDQVNLTDVPYGILEDYGLPLVSLIPYTTNTLDSTNLMNFGTIRQVMLSLNSSIVSASHPYKIDLNHFDQVLSNYKSSSWTPVVLLRYDMSRYSKTAVERGDVTMHNNKVIINNNSANLYEKLSLFTATSCLNDFQSKNIKLCFPEELIVSNGIDMSQIEIRFEEGAGFQKIGSDGRVEYQYSTDGLKEIVIRVQNASTGEWSFSHFPISIVSLAPKLKLRGLDGSLDNRKKSLYFVPKQGVHSGGTLQWILSDNNHSGKFVKPLIFVEGFDPYPIVYNKNDKMNFSLGNIFRGSQKYYKILGMGYDILFVDYNDGLDDIKRNAALFEEILQYINGHKDPDKGCKNTVVGLSMGGLVASYGLRDMELKRIPHQTKKYISYDSPHLGANVPLGAMYMVHHLLYASQFKKIRSQLDSKLGEKGYPYTTEQFRGYLNKPAIKQMLRFSDESFKDFFDKSCVLEENYYMPDSYGEEYLKFHNKYEWMGLPRSTYNVAFSNGAPDAAPLYPDGEELFSLKAHSYSSFGVIASILSGRLGLRTPVITHISLASATLSFDYSINSMPCSVPYSGVIRLTKYYLCGLHKVEYTLSRMTVHSGPNRDLYYKDSEPGGVYDLNAYYVYKNEKLLKEADGALGKFFKNLFLKAFNYHYGATLRQKEFCLVPERSALWYNDKREDTKFDRVYNIPFTKSENHILFGVRFPEFCGELLSDNVEMYTPIIDSTANVCSCGTQMDIKNPDSRFKYKWVTGYTLDANDFNYQRSAIIHPSEVYEERKGSPFFSRGFVYVEAYVDSLKYSVSDTCYVWIGAPDISESSIAQLKVENGYNGKYLPYPTVRVDWKNWGNITNVEWGHQIDLPGSTVIGDVDFVGRELDQTAYNSFSGHSMIRYEQKSKFGSNQMNSTGLSEITDTLIKHGPDGDEPINPNDFRFPVITELNGIPNRLLELSYVPSRTLFDHSGAYKLTYQLVNECGKSGIKNFDYYFMDNSSLLFVHPTVVTDVDAVLKESICPHHNFMPINGQYVNNRKYIYGIWSEMGVLQHMGEAELDEPLGVLNLPRGHYIIKVWSDDQFVEFNVYKQ